MSGMRFKTQHYGISQHDQAAHEHYSAWCQKLGIVPAKTDVYLKTTQSIKPGVIAWAAAK
jgi:hypothetical protein